MSAALSATGLLPDPPYLFVPFGAVFGGLLWSAWAWMTNHNPDLPRAWVVGNVVGAAAAALLLPVLLAAGVN